MLSFKRIVLFCGSVLIAASVLATGPDMKNQAEKIPPAISQAVQKTDYASVRIKPFPAAVQCWTYRKFTFLETMDKVRALGIKFLQAYPGQPLGGDFKSQAFDHNLAAKTREAIKQKLREAGLSVVAYGVVNIGQNIDEMRKVFNFAREMGIGTIVCEPRPEDFDLIEKLVKEYNIRVALHNHPAPSRYAFPMVALENIKNRDERIGVCADTGHWMREGLKPTECLRLLEGRIIDVHLKDRSDFGKAPSAVDIAWGAGKAGVKEILAELTLQDYPGFLTVEYENEAEVMTPEPAIKKGFDYVSSVTYYRGYEQILKRYGWYYEKHGWNHYGPGYFELDEKSGVLKSQGGMGLLWYSVKKYKNFVLELDYKCSKPDTNSGIFIRIPEVIVSNDYIYNSFEVQINDAGQGIHKTGAIYDAEPPRFDASLPAGEWNHLKIICKDKKIQIELNGKLIVDWLAEPRGKIKSYSLEGYIGLQNHDSLSPIYFKNIFIKEL